MRCKLVAEGVNALRAPERAMLVITHYQRLLDYIVPDGIHVLAKGRIVKRAARNWRWSWKPRATRNCRQRRLMNAEVRAIKTPAEQALSAAYEAARGRLPGKARSRLARGCLRAVRDGRAAAPAGRGMEIYRPARADARGLSDCAAPPDAAAKQRAKGAGDILAGIECRRLVFVDGAFAPDLSDLAPEPGLIIGSLAQALANGDALVARMSARPSRPTMRRWRSTPR